MRRGRADGERMMAEKHIIRLGELCMSRKTKAIWFICIGLFSLILAGGIIYRVKNPVIEEISGNTEAFTYNNRHYYMNDFYVADEDRFFIGKTKKYHDNIYAVGNSDSPDYFVIVGSDNTANFKAENCEIATSGEITKVLIDPGIREVNDRVLSAKEDLEMISKLSSVNGEEQEFIIDNYHTQGNTFYYEYDNCPVTNAENLGGYVALAEDKWIFVSPANYEKMEQLENNTVKVQGRVIENQEILEWLQGSVLVKYIE